MPVGGFRVTWDTVQHKSALTEATTAFIQAWIITSKVKLSHYTPWRRMGESRYSSYSFLTSAPDGGEWSASRLGRALLPGKGPPVPIFQEAGWAPEPVWTQGLEEKILCLCRGSNPGRPVRSQILYWLSYPGSYAWALGTEWQIGRIFCENVETTTLLMLPLWMGRCREVLGIGNGGKFPCILDFHPRWMWVRSSIPGETPAGGGEEKISWHPDSPSFYIPVFTTLCIGYCGDNI
jgi:hypothetical protein